MLNRPIESRFYRNGANDNFFYLLVIVTDRILRAGAVALSFSCFAVKSVASHRQLQPLPTFRSLTLTATQIRFAVIVAHRSRCRLVAQLTSQLFHVMQILLNVYLFLWRWNRIGNGFQPRQSGFCLYLLFCFFNLFLCFKVLSYFKYLFWNLYRSKDGVFFFASLAFYESHFPNWVFLATGCIASVLLQSWLFQVLTRSFSFDCSTAVARNVDSSSAAIWAMSLPTSWSFFIFSMVHLDNAFWWVVLHRKASRCSLRP